MSQPSEPQDAPLASPTSTDTVRCPICGNIGFDPQAVRAQGEHGMSVHFLDLLVCRTCRYVLAFYRG